jgi:hypothetical protein
MKGHLRVSSVAMPPVKEGDAGGNGTESAGRIFLESLPFVPGIFSGFFSGKLL